MWKYSLSLFCCFNACLFVAHAQTVTWSLPPTYQTLEEYGDVYKVRENGKVGLVGFSGEVLARPVYDSITPFNEQLALGLEIENGKYILKAIISQSDYRLYPVADRYYVLEKEMFFCDRKLAVYDDRNKWGYLLPDGSVFISCQYQRAYPFYEGLARVDKNKKRIAYLKSDGNELTIDIERQGYVLVNGTAFNEMGEACVIGQLAGNKSVVIDKQGHTKREVQFSTNGKPKNFVQRKPFAFLEVAKTEQRADGVEPFKEGQNYGFATTDTKKIVLLPQFAEADSFRGGYAKVKSNGKYGILQLQEGDFSGGMGKSTVRFKNGRGEEVKYTVTVPACYQDKPITLTVNEGGVVNEIPLDLAGGTHSSHVFVPDPIAQESSWIYSFSLYADGLLLWNDEQTLALEYIKDLPPVLSAPQITSVYSVDAEGYVRADSNNKVDVCTTVTNPSSSPISVTVTIEGNGVESVNMEVSVPAQGSKVVTTIIQNVKERKPVKVVARTSTGIMQSSVIKVKPFI